MVPEPYRTHQVTDGPVHCPLLDAEAARALLDAHSSGRETVQVSLDLGRSESELTVDSDGAWIAPDLRIAWPDIEEIAESGERCYAAREDGSVWPVGVYSETTGWYRSLIRTGGTPTTLVAGFTMHRI